MTTSTELARRAEPAGSLALDPGQTQWTDVQRAALAQLKLQDAPEADLAVFLHHCQRTGLDPFARQVYMIGRWDSKEQRNVYTIQTGIDGFRSIAESHPQYGGQIGPEWCGPDGKWTDVWLKQGPPAAARVGVIRKDREHPTYGVALFGEYAVYAGSGNTRSLNSMWRTKGAHMVAKCAEALALRKAFPKTLAGLYTPEEMAREDMLRHDAERTDMAGGEQQGGPEEIDWEVKLAGAAGDVKALQDLYKLAAALVPNDHALADRIAKAGQDAKAAGDAPLEAEVVEEHDGVEPESDEPLATRAQLTKFHTQLSKLKVAADDKLPLLSTLLHREVGSSAEATKAEMTGVIDLLDGMLGQDDPVAVLASTLAQLRAREGTGA